MLNVLQRLSWKNILLVAALILFDLSVHPLTLGPDRLIHDPAVYRLWDTDYMVGDWYTGMAVASGVYPFYAALINASHLLAVPEELWRILVYLTCLTVLYGSMVAIGRLFTKSWLVAPIIATSHYLITSGTNQPVWLYGPFIHIDGGLAPRSIGMAASFLALYYLMRGTLRIPAIILGLATLIHVSNSLIVFSLYIAVWVLATLLTTKRSSRELRRTIISELLISITLYCLAGGWFALKTALNSFGIESAFSTEKFIWTWIYVRAAYMALPDAGLYWWVRLAAHAIAIIGGFIALRPLITPPSKRPLITATLVGIGALGYFFLFYLFAFITPWLPGFQFYSLRVVYLAYFIAYLFIAVGMIKISHELLFLLARTLPQRARLAVGYLILLGTIGFIFVSLPKIARSPITLTHAENLQLSIWHLLDTTRTWSYLVPDNQKLRPPGADTLRYILAHPEPVLAPPNWNTYSVYLPNVASFKSFGFTAQGLPEWYERINDVTLGDLDQLYRTQKQQGNWEAVTFEWLPVYNRLSEEDIYQLSEKYDFRLFLGNSNRPYSFPLLAEDHDYRLYKVKPQGPGIDEAAYQAVE